MTKAWQWRRDRSEKAVCAKLNRLFRRCRVDAGFTLIELLVVIIIIAVLAAIAIPTYLGQRQKAQDTQAYSLVRNALTAVQTAFVDTQDYTQVTEEMLDDIETSIDFVHATENLVSTATPSILEDVPAEAAKGEVAFYANGSNVIDLACRSQSGNLFGIQVDSVDLNNTGYVKVRVIDKSASIGW